MKSLLAIVLLVGLLGLTMGEDVDLQLLKRLLLALKEKKSNVETGAEQNLEKRNSYGIMWNGGKDRTLKIYLQKSTNCANPCKFEITFQNEEDGKTVGNELDATFDNENGGLAVFTESQIMDLSTTDSKDKGTAEAVGNGQNAVGGARGRLPDHLMVRVCRIERNGLRLLVRACNKRLVDTTQGRDAVFFKTVKDDGKPRTNV